MKELILYFIGGLYVYFELFIDHYYLGITQKAHAFLHLFTRFVCFF